MSAAAANTSTAAAAAATTIQLAFPGEYMHDAAWTAQPSQTYTEHDDAYTDKVGGVPMWHADLPQPPMPHCPRCAAPLFLLTQLYLPASVSSHATDRNLYVFACNKIECCLSDETRCWRAIRLAVGGAAESTAPIVAAAPTVPTPTLAATAASPAARKQPIATAATPAKQSAAAKDDEWGANAGWSSDEAEAATPAKTKSAVAATPAASSKPVPSSATKKALANEWGSTGGWSDDDESTEATPKKKAAAANDDDDAVLSALLAKQSLAKVDAETAKAAAAAKAEEKAAKRAAKAEAKRQAQEALLAAALEAREQAAVSASSSAASTAVPSIASPVLSSLPTTTAFRPFYLAWAPEPATAESDFSHELRLLKEYEQRQIEEGPDDMGGGAVIDESATSSAAPGEDDEDNFMERRDDEVQVFFDRIDRMKQQCVRYYGRALLHHNQPYDADTCPALFSSKKEVDFFEAMSGAKNSMQAAGRLCPHCGAPRILEAQLMPKLLFELHVDTINAKDPGMDWSTIDIYTCSKSCCPNEYVDEGVHVQPPM